ncbi:heparanase-like protein 3, partial [Tanacetum coccineum]
FSPLKLRLGGTLKNRLIYQSQGDEEPCSQFTITLDGLFGYTQGLWNSSNAEALMKHMVDKGFTIHGWELGNELSTQGIGAKITADQYALDTIALQNLV